MNDTQWLFLEEKIGLSLSKSLVGDDELSYTSRRGQQIYTKAERPKQSRGDTGRLALGPSKVGQVKPYCSYDTEWQAIESRTHECLKLKTQ